MTATENLLLDLLHSQSFEDLLAIWRSHDPATWKKNIKLYSSLGESFVRQGELILALDVLAAGLGHTPKNRKLRQLQALAYAGIGTTDRAREILLRLRGERRVGGETIGILARTHKDLWRLTGDQVFLEEAFRLYRAAYERAKRTNRVQAIYNGINAATVSLLLGSPRRARRIAAEVSLHCEARLQKSTDYWAMATLAEAALVKGDPESAAKHYQQAKEMGRGNFRELTASRRQARLILECHYGAHHRNDLDSCFALGPVMIFAGHMIDGKGRRPERFPERNVPKVAAAIHGAVRRHQPCFAYTSAACGSDLLFLEALRKNKAPTCVPCVVLPFSPEDFAETSVRTGGGSWEERFKSALRWARRAGRVEQASEHPLVLESASYDYANMLLQGMAAIKADQLEADQIGLAVWDGEDPDGPGGTASIVRRWIDAGLRVEIIHPSGEPLQNCTPAPEIKRSGDMRIVAVLFADVVKFSRLTESQMPIFNEKFLAAVAQVVDRVGVPELRNTWGDGLFFAFEDVRQAGVLALELQKEIAGREWESDGLPQGLTLRIGLHAGPAYVCVNPVKGGKDLLGFHVSRGARIEPVTESGEIYCSQEFVALARATGVKDFAFEYVGQKELPKGAGTIPLYSLRPNRAKQE